MKKQNYFQKTGSKFGILLMGVSVILITGCGSGENKTESQEEEVLADDWSEEVEDLSKAQKVFYAMPSPFEMAALLIGSGVTFNNEMLNSPDKVKSYSTTRQKAVNLGIYGADLSYCSMYQQTQESMQYLVAVKTLLDELGISSALEMGTMQRIEDNKDNKDSIQQIVSEAYLEANSYLKDNERDNTSGLILAGGWIEGLYIATELANQQPGNNDLLGLIAEQKYSLENLVGLLSSYNDPGLDDLLNDLRELQTIFEQLEEDDTAVIEQKTHTDKKVTVIGGGDDLMVTPELLSVISSKAAAIRNKLI